MSKMFHAIPKESHRDISAKESNPFRLYGLSKIHKNSVPCRPTDNLIGRSKKIHRKDFFSSTKFVPFSSFYSQNFLFHSQSLKLRSCSQKMVNINIRNTFSNKILELIRSSGTRFFFLFSVDDTFIALAHCKESPQIFLEHLNNQHDCIRFVRESSGQTHFQVFL